MALKKHFGSSDDEGEEMTLQITSMADIFTIILVFLLKSFSSEMASISPNQGTILPSVGTSTQNQIKGALTLEINAGSVLIDQKPIAVLSRFVAGNEEELQKNVLQSLLAQRKRNQEKKIGLKGGNSRDPASYEEADSQLLVLADEKTPYNTLKVIMNSAAIAGYVDLQLIVLKPE